MGLTKAKLIIEKETGSHKIDVLFNPSEYQAQRRRILFGEKGAGVGRPCDPVYLRGCDRTKRQPVSGHLCAEYAVPAAGPYSGNRRGQFYRCLQNYPGDRGYNLY